jgi:hypothetical protein
VRLNIGNLLRGGRGIIVEPMVIDSGFDEYYYVVNPVSAVDLYYMYSKALIVRASIMNNTMAYIMYSHIIIYLSQNLGVDYNEFINKSLTWNPDTASMQETVMVSFKRIPMVRLLWIGAVIMIIGEVITILSKYYRTIG